MCLKSRYILLNSEFDFDNLWTWTSLLTSHDVGWRNLSLFNGIRQEYKKIPRKYDEYIVLFEQ